MAKSEGKTMELGYGNAKEGRSTSLAIDLWIKTCKNAQDSQIDPKAREAIFGGNFRISQEQEKFGGFRWKHKSNSWQPRALIPYDAEKTAWVTRSSRIDGGNGRTHARTRRTRGRTQRNTRTQTRYKNRFPYRSVQPAQ